jgi:hypothetical protein
MVFSRDNFFIKSGIMALSFFVFDLAQGSAANKSAPFVTEKAALLGEEDDDCSIDAQDKRAYSFTPEQVGDCARLWNNLIQRSLAKEYTRPKLLYHVKVAPEGAAHDALIASVDETVDAMDKICNFAPKELPFRINRPVLSEHGDLPAISFGIREISNRWEFVIHGFPGNIEAIEIRNDNSVAKILATIKARAERSQLVTCPFDYDQDSIEYALEEAQENRKTFTAGYLWYSEKECNVLAAERLAAKKE